MGISYQRLFDFKFLILKYAQIFFFELPMNVLSFLKSTVMNNVDMLIVSKLFKFILSNIIG